MTLFFMERLVEKCRPLYTNPDFRLLFILNLLVGLGYSFVGPFMSMWGTLKVKMSESTFGIFMTMTAIAGVLAGTILAHYSDTKFSRRSMLLLGSGTAALGYLGYAFLESYWALVFVGTVILGVSTITFSQLFAYARELLSRSSVPKEQGAFYMNAFRMFFALSWTVGPAIAQAVMVHFSYEGLFLCASSIFVVFAVVVWFRVPSLPPSGGSTKGGGASASLVKLLLRWDLAAHLLAFVLVTAATTIGMMNLPLLILKTLGGSEKSVGIAYCVGPLFELPFMLYFGWLATKHDTAKIIRIGMLIALVYYVSLVFAGAPWHVYFCQILSAAAVAVISGVAITYFQSHLPHHPGTATNLYSNASRVGSTLGYFIFGQVAEHYGYRVVFCTCALFATVGFLLMWVKVHVPDAEALDPEEA